MISTFERRRQNSQDKKPLTAAGLTVRGRIAVVLEIPSGAVVLELLPRSELSCNKADNFANGREKTAALETGAFRPVTDS